MNAVEIRDLSFKYKGSKENILKNINLEIKKGEITAIVGKSGCGKSTLCRCICGLIPRVYPGKLSGDVLLFGEHIKDMNLAQIVPVVGMIFQNPSTQLFSPTIEDELAFGPENLCVDREEIGKRMNAMLEVIHMEDYRYENPNHLSGGQQQLIAIASVLMLNPKILICDEIMSWIDEDGRDVVKKVLLKLKREGKTIIMVDHNTENIEIADKIIYV
ncbi:ABC transporter ATP-binding protein [Geosporobacter ferrireducens]|uniref:ABC transporter ATP-binding protein n=2 Tax=Geosporobacter ferrireducens TaxID=1424294 RepID=A0A1D8GF67_9FIRM|nr:ABC transporter ATP-binding protein [Geosporobacter ferrireducens]MTI54751.1 ABC transporter ATP-binding protein [Geosporobacter ferrireducens]